VPKPLRKLELSDVSKHRRDSNIGLAISIDTYQVLVHILINTVGQKG